MPTFYESDGLASLKHQPHQIFKSNVACTPSPISSRQGSANFFQCSHTPEMVITPEKSALRLVYGKLIRASERWRRVRMGESEKNQLRLIREDLEKGESPCLT